MSSSNYLKTFGAGVDVAGQIATDKALRRKTTNSEFDTTVAEINGRIEEIPDDEIANLYGELHNVTKAGGAELFPHTLGRVPSGAIIMQSDILVFCSGLTPTEFEITGAAGDVIVWVV